MIRRGNAEDYAREVSRLLQCETIQRPGAEGEFTRLREEIARLFPGVHARCACMNFEGSLLYRWRGEKSEDALLLMSHQDVVEAPGAWQYPPFSGTVADGKLWGRGALDVKGNLYCILRAVEELIEDGFLPARDVYIASSNCEEVGGNDLIADYLKRNGISIGMLLDEGSAIQGSPVAGVPGTFALVSVAEKGYADIRCVARSNGGHAAAPGKHSPLPRLGAFMSRIDEDGLFPTIVSAECAQVYLRLGECLPEDQRALLNALRAGKAPSTAQVEGCELASRFATTLAFTMAGGSSAANVMPREAWVICNVRIAPGQSVDSVMDAMRAIAGEYDVELELLRSNAPSGVTDANADAFHRIERALDAAIPGVEALPMLLSGGTDTKHFAACCDNCLRFTPFRISAQQQAAVHGVDENIDIAVLPEAVNFYKALIQAQ